MVARRTAAAVACVLLACTAGADARRSLRSSSAPTPWSLGLKDVETNVCNLDWYYCPRDPGCKTYTMSVHETFIRDTDSAKPIKAEDLKPGDHITLEIKGMTTIKSMPDQGSWRIYGLSGKNVAAGDLHDVFTLTPPMFAMTVDFELTSDCFGTDKYFEFGLDVFQKGQGSDEGMCVEFADIEYLAYEKAKPDPPFVDYCVDNGDGTFTPKIVPITGTPVPAPNCNGPLCNLDYYLCPRDPGCITYTMSVSNVVVDVEDATGLKAGDKVSLHVNGTTSLRSVPVAGSYRIYALDGGNAAAGVLSDVMTLSDCGPNGCYFGMDVPFTLTPGCFGASTGWFEFGLDVFQKKSGSDEGFCIEVANPTYVNYEQTTPQPPPGFKQLCIDEGWGHYVSKTVDEIVHKADCVLV